MSEIRPTDPYIEFTFDTNGEMSIEAHNYPGSEKSCQGKLATEAFEQSLANANLIPPITESDRTYKQNNPPLKPKQQIKQTNQNQIRY